MRSNYAYLEHFKGILQICGLGASNQSKFHRAGVKYWRDWDVLIMWENARRQQGWATDQNAQKEIQGTVKDKKRERVWKVKYVHLCEPIWIASLLGVPKLALDVERYDVVLWYQNYKLSRVSIWMGDLCFSSMALSSPPGHWWGMGDRWPDGNSWSFENGTWEDKDLSGMKCYRFHPPKYPLFP